MKTVDFKIVHIEQAMQLVKDNYYAERVFVPELPAVDTTLNLAHFAENKLGVAAVDGDKVLGFLCCYEPFDNAFSIHGLRGVFSPMGANGAVANKKAEIYARLYQAASEKWVQAGAVSHAINLYAHDKEAQAQFFRYGFGMRCVDAIRGMDEVNAPSIEGYSIIEITQESALEALPLENMLHKGYINSPFFMFREEVSEPDFMEYFSKSKPTCFVAKYSKQNIAFIIAEHDGETFIQDTPGYYHITGLYCLPEQRGKGLSQYLLNKLVQELKKHGYTRLGVDYESFNPSGSGFWKKYFSEYAYGVVRRIDESVVG